MFSSKKLSEEEYCISIRRSIHPWVCQSINLSVTLLWISISSSQSQRKLRRISCNIVITQSLHNHEDASLPFSCTGFEIVCLSGFSMSSVLKNLSTTKSFLPLFFCLPLSLAAIFPFCHFSCHFYSLPFPLSATFSCLLFFLLPFFLSFLDASFLTVCFLKLSAFYSQPFASDISLSLQFHRLKDHFSACQNQHFHTSFIPLSVVL